LPDPLKESIIVSVHEKDLETDCNNYLGISMLSTSYKILSNILRSKLSPYLDEIIGDYHCVGFDVIDQLLFRFSAFVRYWKKKGFTVRQCISYS
jgi:hypothetical protein